MLETTAFYLFAALVISCFVVTVMAKQTIYAFSALAAGMIFISGFFFLLNADFMGVAQIVVYTGAVMALYVFGMMFFDSSKAIDEPVKGGKHIVALTSIAALIIVLMIILPSSVVAPHEALEGDNTQNIGVALFTHYLLPFELSGVLLLTAMICGIVLASKKMEYTAKEESK